MKSKLTPSQILGEKKPYCIQFADKTVVLILEGQKGFVIKETSCDNIKESSCDNKNPYPRPLGHYRQDWCIDNIEAGTAKIWTGKVELEF